MYVHQLIDVHTYIIYIDKGEIKSAACRNIIFVCVNGSFFSLILKYLKINVLHFLF